MQLDAFVSQNSIQKGKICLLHAVLWRLQWAAEKITNLSNNIQVLVLGRFSGDWNQNSLIDNNSAGCAIFAFPFANSIVSWGSQFQHLITLEHTEAHFLALPGLELIRSFQVYVHEKIGHEDTCQLNYHCSGVLLVLLTLSSRRTLALNTAKTAPADSFQCSVYEPPNKKTLTSAPSSEDSFHTIKFLPAALNFGWPFSVRTPTVAHEPWRLVRIPARLKRKNHHIHPLINPTGNLWLRKNSEKHCSSIYFVMFIRIL